MLSETGTVVSISVAANQRVLIQGTADLRVAYDEANLADSMPYFLVSMTSNTEQLLPFIIEPHGAMSSQRVLYIRTDSTPTPLRVWLQDGGV